MQTERKAEQIIITGNNIDSLKNYPDNFFDSIVTDPPYGLGKEPNAEEMLRAWITEGYLEVKGTGFMGKEWDAFVPQPIFWKEVFRVLKHGGHVVSFFGTRTYDWGVMSMRLAGFEVRDCIQWIYGSGFPKSHNISKAIDKMPKANDRLSEFAKILKSKRIELGLSISDADNLICDDSTMYNFLEGRNVDGVMKVYPPNEKYYERIKQHFNILGWEHIVENNLSTIGTENGNYGFQKDGERWKEERHLKIHTTEKAKQWDGWGSALKPANEPIVLARKPLEKGLSIAENVLKWGTGAINIDASRIGTETIKGQKAGQGFNNVKGFGVNTKQGEEQAKEYISEDVNGRFPSNVILTHHPECKCLGLKKVKGQIDKPTNRKKFEGTWNEGNTGLRNNTNLSREGYADENGEETIENWNCHDDCPIKVLDEQSGERKAGGKVVGTEPSKTGQNGIYNTYNRIENDPYSDTGGASRFFYVAKASKSERNFGLESFEEKQTVGGGGLTAELREDGSLETSSAGVKFGSIKALRSNVHPTVKPVKLMQYLVRMITPPNGTVLDPFSGSGTTGVACKIDGFNFVGLEISEEYGEIARARIEKFVEEREFIDDCKIFESEKNKIESQYRLFE